MRAMASAAAGAALPTPSIGVAPVRSRQVLAWVPCAASGCLVQDLALGIKNTVYPRDPDRADDPNDTRHAFRVVVCAPQAPYAPLPAAAWLMPGDEVCFTREPLATAGTGTSTSFFAGLPNGGGSNSSNVSSAHSSEDEAIVAAAATAAAAAAPSFTKTPITPVAPPPTAPVVVLVECVAASGVVGVAGIDTAEASSAAVSPSSFAYAEVVTCNDTRSSVAAMEAYAVVVALVQAQARFPGRALAVHMPSAFVLDVLTFGAAHVSKWRGAAGVGAANITAAASQLTAQGSTITCTNAGCPLLLQWAVRVARKRTQIQ